MTIILSACWMVESRCATMIVVRPSMSFSSASVMRLSVSVSMFAVASSSTRIAGSRARVRAKEMSCLCPAERVLPRSVTGSS